MKKFLISLLLITYLFSKGEPGRVVAKLYEGNSKYNDLYIIALNGYYLPLIADDLEPNDNITYINITKAIYRGE